jgi:hypothetical protein
MTNCRPTVLLPLTILATLTANISAEQLTQDVLRDLIKKNVADGLLTLTEPEVRKTQDLLVVTPGSYDPQGVTPMTPLDYPLQTQALVEASRTHAPAGLSLAEWNATLSQLEGIVVKQLDVITQHKSSTKDLLTALEKTRRDISSILSAAYTKQAAGREVVIAFPKSAGKYRVTIKAIPTEGAAVYFVGVAKHQLLRAAGKLDDLIEWYEVVDEVNYMGGQFYFRVRWRDGKRKDSGIVPIRKSESIELRPD